MASVLRQLARLSNYPKGTLSPRGFTISSYPAAGQNQPSPQQQQPGLPWQFIPLENDSHILSGHGCFSSLNSHHID